MKKILIIFLFMSVAITGVISCKKIEESAVEDEEIEAYLSEEATLKRAMKRTSMDTRRLAKALESKDWIEIETWANELKQGIGVSCVNLYIKTHPGVSAEFIILGDRFYNATNRLIISCKKRDTEIADAQFAKMMKSCEMCHDGYKKQDNDSSDE
ncbi:MAG: cytochrome c [Candidatus Scalindua sp.]|nr:cytochrome c [Candidatus Scalindua sp.]MBT5305103.1 cytochrome c [Candidatus Scalindua sp.]MBT6051081.1 cytochrome c [Candidatus Scalindua sp.]MBT6229712.1 cytochrome c [Candidatus Scalindua sp.]MBT6564301.1 cytochrome c [Candidatus Scalindua sp.]